MNTNLIARTFVTVNATNAEVWDALVNPGAIKQYYFGTNAVSDWLEGSSIVWKGDWKGKPYEDKGVILKLDPGKTFQYSHFSPLAELPEKSENYHTVTIELSGKGNQTRVSPTQDNNLTEEGRKHSEQNCGTMLAPLKKFLTEQPAKK
jgi:uncharacterized protein YndB with AHSA1/START domain